MGLAICRHIKLGGGRCGSPALRGQDYCYFHAGAHRTIPSVNLPGLASKKGTQTWGTIPAGHQNDPWRRNQMPDEAAAVQLGFTRLIQGVAQGLLNVRQAKLFLTALHEAAADLRDRTATGDAAVTSNRQRLQLISRSPIDPSPAVADCLGESQYARR